MINRYASKNFHPRSPVSRQRPPTAGLMAVIEARELLVVITKVDHGGKPMYSNAESRAAAVLTEL